MTRSTVALVFILMGSSMAVGQEVRIHDYSGWFEHDLRIAAGPSDFQAVWNSGKFCGKSDVSTRHLASDGTFLSPETPVGAACLLKPPADVAVLPSGVSLVVFQMNDGQGGADVISGRLFDATLQPLGPEFYVSQSTGVVLFKPRVAGLTSNRFVVVWWDNSGHVYGRLVMPDGSMPLAQRELPSDTVNTSKDPQPAPTRTGGFAVAWTQVTLPPRGQDVLLRLFDASLQPVSSSIVVNDESLGSVQSGWPDICPVTDGFLVVWNQNAGTELGNIKARWGWNFDHLGKTR